MPPRRSSGERRRTRSARSRPPPRRIHHRRRPARGVQPDHPSGAELGDEVLTLIARRRHLHALGVEQLHQRGTDSAGGPVDQDSIARAQSGHPQAGVCVVRRLHAGRSVGQVPVLGHGGHQSVHGDGDQLRVGAGPAVDEAEHAVAHGVRLDALAAVDDHAGVLRPQHLHPGSRPATEGLVDPGVPGPVGAVGAVHGGEVHAHQDLAATGNRVGDIVEDDDFRPPVSPSDRCSHGHSMTTALCC